MQKIIINSLILILFSLSGCENQGVRESKSDYKAAKNIIIFIGDGMGIAQLSAGITTSSIPYNIERFPYSGFSKTYSADNYITDSAGGGTAIACGTKTNNGMIGVTPDNTSVSSILEIAHKNGLATGVVSTSAITHATPASFVAHNSGRENYEEIAKDFLKGTVDVFLGGGEDHFRTRADGVDLTINLEEQGYSVVYTLNDLEKSNSEKIAGLLAKVHMPKASDGRRGVLTAMTMKAIETLNKNKVGFVLMVEGSMIDWGGHEQNLEYIVSEMSDFDDAIGDALNFAEEMKNTLVVVTADHETGGLALTGGNIMNHQVAGKFAGGEHTGIMVPVFSFGPGASKFSGIHENTFFFNEFLNLLDIKK